MSTGYTIVARNDEMYYVEDAPVILKTFAITKDEQTGKVLLQCKFENLASDKVVSIQVSVKCFSIDMIPRKVLSILHIWTWMQISMSNLEIQLLYTCQTLKQGT